MKLLHANVTLALILAATACGELERHPSDTVIADSQEGASDPAPDSAVGRDVATPRAPGGTAVPHVAELRIAPRGQIRDAVLAVTAQGFAAVWSELADTAWSLRFDRLSSDGTPSGNTVVLHQLDAITGGGPRFSPSDLIKIEDHALLLHASDGASVTVIRFDDDGVTHGAPLTYATQPGRVARIVAVEGWPELLIETDSTVVRQRVVEGYEPTQAFFASYYERVLAAVGGDVLAAVSAHDWGSFELTLGIGVRCAPRVPVMTEAAGRSPQVVRLTKGATHYALLWSAASVETPRLQDVYLTTVEAEYPHTVTTVELRHGAQWSTPRMGDVTSSAHGFTVGWPGEGEVLLPRVAPSATTACAGADHISTRFYGPQALAIATGLDGTVALLWADMRDERDERDIPTVGLFFRRLTDTGCATSE